MSAPRRVCQHVRSGICETCANPLARTTAEPKPYVTDFGRKLIGVCREAGIPTRPRNKNRGGRHTNTLTPKNG